MEEFPWIISTATNDGDNSATGADTHAFHHLITMGHITTHKDNSDLTTSPSDTEGSESKDDHDSEGWPTAEFENITEYLEELSGLEPVCTLFSLFFHMLDVVASWKTLTDHHNLSGYTAPVAHLHGGTTPTVERPPAARALSDLRDKKR